MRLSFMGMRNLAGAGLTGLILVGWVSAGSAAVSDERAAVMKDVMASFKVLIGIAKSEQFDAAEVNRRATAVAAALDRFKDLFPDGSQSADDKALPLIWSDRAGFEAARNKAGQAALELAAVTDSSGFKPSFDVLAASCKGCHDSYRAK